MAPATIGISISKAMARRFVAVTDSHLIPHLSIRSALIWRSLIQHRPLLYLGRACRYRLPVDHRPCPSRYWSSHRFAEDVVDATRTAIKGLLATRGSSSNTVSLIGYSRRWYARRPGRLAINEG